MHTTIELMELAKQRLALRHGLTLPMTDYRLAKLMGLRLQTVSGWRTGVRGIGTEYAQRFAEACELSPEYVYACVQMERAEPAERPILERIAAAFKGKAAALTAALALAFFGATLAPPPAHASSDLYLMRSVRRWLRRALPRFSRDSTIAKLRLALPAVAVLAASGCATMRDPAELAWQTLHVVDTLQTRSAVKDPCYQEGESAWLIGHRPSDATLAAWSVGMAAGHAGITHWLRETDHPRLARAWQAITLAHAAYGVGHNFSIGVRIGSQNRTPPGCIR